MSTFVLVHGAFHGGWVWRDVARSLRAAGHDVNAPTLTGCGDRHHLLTRDVRLATHVEDVVSTLEHEDLQQVILVGHSYAGVVISAAADRAAERIARVVYLDAAAPQAGQASTGAFAEGTAGALETLSAGDGWLLPPLPLDAVGITDAALGRWVDARRHPHPMRTLHEPLETPRGKLASLPKSYVQHTRKEALVALFSVDPLSPFVERAKREGWRFSTIDAGHDAMLTAPERVSETLQDHAR